MIVTHAKAATAPNDPTHEISSDAWNEAHTVADGESLALVPVAVAPSAHATNGIFYILDDGVTKSLCFKFPGDENVLVIGDRAK